MGGTSLSHTPTLPSSHTPMRFLATLEQFLQDLRTQKLRTTLTILGITWGTVAVVVLLAFGVGLERQTHVNMHGMGDGIVVMFGGRTSKAFQGFRDGRYIPLHEDDARVLQVLVVLADLVGQGFPWSGVD